MTDFEDFVYNVFTVSGITPNGKVKLDFATIMKSVPIIKEIYDNAKKIFTLDDMDTAYGATWEKIFSMSDFDTAYSTYFGKIFSLTDFSTAWANQLNKIFSTSDLTGSILKTQILDMNMSDDIYNWVYTYLINPILYIFGFKLERTNGVTYVKPVGISATTFTFEGRLYLFIRRLRNAIVNAVNDLIDWTTETLPDQVDFYIPLFSRTGIHIATKVGDDWQLDTTEWPETVDPQVYHAYFQLPDFLNLHLFTVPIPVIDLSKDDVPKYVNGDWIITSKYNTMNLVDDFIGFGGIALVCYLLGKAGFQKYNDKFVKNMVATAKSINQTASNQIIQNTILFNKSLFTTVASLTAIVSNLFSSAAAYNYMYNIIDQLGLDDYMENPVLGSPFELVNSQLSDIIEYTDESEEKITSVDAKVENVHSDLESLSAKLTRRFY